MKSSSASSNNTRPLSKSSNTSSSRGLSSGDAKKKRNAISGNGNKPERMSAIKKSNYYLMGEREPTSEMFKPYMDRLIQPHVTSYDNFTSEMLSNVSKYMFPLHLFPLTVEQNEEKVRFRQERRRRQKGDAEDLLQDEGEAVLTKIQKTARVNTRPSKDDDGIEPVVKPTNDKVTLRYMATIESITLSKPIVGDNLIDQTILADKPVSEEEDESSKTIHQLQKEAAQVKRFGLRREMYPKDARIASLTYGGSMKVTVRLKNEDTGTVEYLKDIEIMQDFPVMLNSSLCNLPSLSPKQKMLQGEEEHEPGGYFIVRGSEVVYRLLTQQRSNYPFALTRPSWTGYKEDFTDKGILVRCRHPKTYITRLVNIHYRKDGVVFMRAGNPVPYYINVILALKALREVSDRDLFLLLTAGTKNKVTLDRVVELLADYRKTFPMIQTREDAIIALGSIYDPSGLRRLEECPVDKTKLLKAGQEVLKNIILPMFCDENEDEELMRDGGSTESLRTVPTASECQKKFDFLVYCIQKLYKFVDGEIVEENLDDFDNHELLTVGELLANTIPLIIYNKIQMVHGVIAKLLRNSPSEVQFAEQRYLTLFRERSKYILPKSCTADITRLFSVGDVMVASPYRPELSQTRALFTKLERINFLRVISHFRATHRGIAFLESNSTRMRRLTPSFWGFICPVHSPDGHLCGLVNHLSHTTEIVTTPARPKELSQIVETCKRLGMIPSTTEKCISISIEEEAPIMLDGTIIGKVANSKLQTFADQLRYCKVSGKFGLPKYMEIACQPKYTSMDIPYLPQLNILTDIARAMRPVRYLPTNQEEWIGSGEQVFLSIAVTPDDIKPQTTHMEIDPTNFMSFLGNLTPFCNFNQSPRCIYQCQMAKQSMAAVFHSVDHRVDTKLFDMKLPQKPLTRTKHQTDLPFDEFNNGCNAVVAVISYTGYDMEDAMIMNKTSFERGMMHGTVFKTEDIDLTESESFLTNRTFNKTEIDADYDNKEYDDLDYDGLPEIGLTLEEGTVFANYFDPQKQKFFPMKWKDVDSATVHSVKVIATDPADYKKIKRAQVTFRLNRNPIIGDKFSSRHGQKGVLSILWPQEDMPFTESGIVPDIVINPHAFPSRMTIGMLVESMSSKAGALHGYFPDATPFTFDEQNTAIDYFGEQLRKAGYNYYGNEVMYSGPLGIPLKADIYIGIVYYQRLRHMVSDKYQCRVGGPTNAITHQPVKGRKKAGGVRMGEMERDALVAYGASAVLKDRFFDCTDSSTAIVCTQCSQMNTVVKPDLGIPQGHVPHFPENNVDHLICSMCRTGEYLRTIYIPYTTKYLYSELSAMGINMKIRVEENSNRNM
ncbi:hypothetical protein FDP41_003950 [Naegleria fowleri]|uniref:DNA-directed RNA polymerase subunit beta n=1 Tax=Naegleria fowleri TaxID=5763 RepID=A0A6A5BJV1_NAEFO|nr:uncharacterized protein FDP41_003950 [Naegleria fowleri]KAF0977297.1 hypothetical protein FDP41_003950 [Naegleria fowleri]